MRVTESIVNHNQGGQFTVDDIVGDMVKSKHK